MNFIQNQPKRLNLKISKTIISKMNNNLEKRIFNCKNFTETGNATVGDSITMF